MAKLRVESTDHVFDAPEGEDLLEILQSNGYPIATSCGGVASCGLCRLSVTEGRELLSPIKPQELHHLGSVAKVLGLRLACQSRIRGDGEIVVRVPEVDDVEARKRRKAERLRADRGRADRDASPPSSRSRPEPVPPSVGRPRAKIEWRPRVLDAQAATSPATAEVAGPERVDDAPTALAGPPDAEPTAPSLSHDDDDGR